MHHHLNGLMIAGAFWLPVVYFQIRLRDLAKKALDSNQPLDKAYHFYFNCWFAFGWPAFIALIVVFYLMANMPIAL